MSFIEIDDKYYVLATSSFTDDRTIVLKQGDSFGIFDRYGDIHQVGQGAQGLYHLGTRFISRMEFSFEGKRPLFLSSNLREENELLSVDLTNPDYISKKGELVQRGTLHILRSKFIQDGVCYEKIRLSNFDMEPLEFDVTFSFDSDFCDIFEVRGTERAKRGDVFDPEITAQQVVLPYVGLDKITRKARIVFRKEPSEVTMEQVLYHISLGPKEAYDIEIAIAFEAGENRPEILGYEEAHYKLTSQLEQIKAVTCDVFTSNEQFNEWINRSRADLITMVSKTEHGLYPYAGVPWYSTPFGRDGIITAWQCLWLDSELTKGVLQYLAATQAREENDFQDAQPGKIFHEKRGGEMAELGEVPFKLYYGTVDATPLFISLAGAYLKRTADEALLRSIWPNIERALEWIDKYGDLDGDGFVEYETNPAKGLINQGWKDSHDSVFHEDGTMARGPIALCEVQGYVYDAKVSAAYIAEKLGYLDRVEPLKQQAEALKRKFNEVFWSEKKKCYVLALDGQKDPCEVVTSNAGHCLFSGIVPEERAYILAKTLLSKKMFSGWGVRTLATDEARYNPMSYHNGSIWPHDNSLVAAGLARYGIQREVHKIITGIFDASLFVDNARLPELFCGFDRRPGEGPTAYPVACSPQAWAVGTAPMLLQAILGIDIDAYSNTIYFRRPELPPFLYEVTIRNLLVNGQQVALQVRRLKEQVDVILLNKDVHINIVVTED